MQDTPVRPTPALRRAAPPMQPDASSPRPLPVEGSNTARIRMRSRKAEKHPLLVALVALGIAALVGFFLTLVVFSAHAADKKSAGAVSFLEGDANVTRGTAATALTLGAPIFDGDRLRTGPSARLEAKLADGSVLRLAPSSELKLDQLSFTRGDTGKKKVHVSLSFGRVWASVTKLFGNESEFEVKTANAVAGVRGTRFGAERVEGGDTTVRVYSGQVLVSNKPIYQKAGHTKANRVQVPGPQEVTQKQWNELIAGAMQQVRVSDNGQMSPVESFAMAGDDWAAWNAERDRAAGIVE